MYNSIAFYNKGSFETANIFVTLGSLFVSLVGTVVFVGMLCSGQGLDSLYALLPWLYSIPNVYLAYNSVSENTDSPGQELYELYVSLPKELKKSIDFNPTLIVDMPPALVTKMYNSLAALRAEYRMNRELSIVNDVRIISALERVNDKTEYLKEHTKTMKEIA